MVGILVTLCRHVHRPHIKRAHRTRISRCRDIRSVHHFSHLVHGFGETAITQFEAGTGGLAAGVDSASLTLFQMLEALPVSEVTSIVAMVLLIVFIVTSADSGALVIQSMTIHKTSHQTRRWRIFWVAMLALTASALLYGGGTSALQTLQAGTIVAALPFTFIVLASGVSLVLGMRSV